MKLFRNPIFVGALVALAIYVVYQNAIAPMRKRGAPARPSAAVPALTPVAPPAAQPVSAALPAAAATATDAAPIPVSAIAAGSIESSFARWVASPRRDPFQVFTREQRQSAKELLTLQATWRQTGGNLAVINGKVVNEGGTILGFQVETIQNDSVWVRGPAGREELEFGGTPAPTGAPGSPPNGLPAPK